ncbi:MAG: hypothetical protein CW694_00115 [Candidatus Syntrophoarchaeum sp. WYZ-LMO15]|nr:MAG: hypothetical protein CW694_00115 [Candidatus Syntrophoarchaeum sp. WYZ-LMO15]
MFFLIDLACALRYAILEKFCTPCAKHLDSHTLIPISCSISGVRCENKSISTPILRTRSIAARRFRTMTLEVYHHRVEHRR